MPSAPWRYRSGMSIPPVIILNSGRCGSTMLSDVLNRHPRILSLSEFFSYVHAHRWYPYPTMTGDQMWRIYTKAGLMGRRLSERPVPGTLYPFEAPGARFTPRNVPPIMSTALPHLTHRHEALFDEMEPVVRSQPQQPPARHLRHLFTWLCERFGKDVWVERSGGSAAAAFRLSRTFPDARMIHLYRDGRDVALSMSRHPAFRMQARHMRSWNSLGLNLLNVLSDERPAAPPVRLLLMMGVLVEPFFRRLGGEPRLAEFGHMWSLLVEVSARILEQLPPDRMLNVKFEDVHADPEGQLRRLVRFIDPGLEDEGWLREVSRIPRQIPPRFERLGPAERTALTEVCQPWLERLGYSP